MGGAGTSRASGAGGCGALCTRYGACLEAFRKLGGEPIFVAAPGRPCAESCAATARDPLVGKVLERIIATCGVRRDCDSFFGCALRLWLGHLSAHPWKRAVLQARRRVRAVTSAMGRAKLSRAMDLCRISGLLASLRKVDRAETGKAARGLVGACADAIKRRMEAVISGLELLVSRLDPDAHQQDCRRLRSWKTPSWLPPGHGAARRLSRALALCDTLDGQRKLAFAVRYAERDAAMVAAAIKAGRAGEAEYYKCAHKARTFSTLTGASQTRAKLAAETLRTVCFERFAVAYLSALRSAGAGFSERSCYKVRVVAGLLSDHARPRVRRSQAALLGWAARRCRSQ